MSPQNYTIKEHCFCPGETISAVIHKMHDHAISSDEIKIVLKEFDRLNNNQIPKPGEIFKIPIFDKYTKRGKEYE